MQLSNLIKRGLTGYVTYLTACSMREVYSEYLLYEPILRILTARGCRAKCEFPCKGLERPGRGDKRRLDFKVDDCGGAIAIEVKWAKSSKLNVTRDLEKLKWFKNNYPKSRAYLCVFGTKSKIEHLALSMKLPEIGRAVYCDVRKTKYGCKFFEVTP